MATTSRDDLGKLILRLTIGILILLHGIAKLSKGVSGVESMLAAQGLPTFIAWGVYVGEIVAPLLLIVGFYTRIAAWLVVVNMVFAIFLAHMSQLFLLTPTGGWQLELQGLFLFGALAIAFLGAGRFSVAGIHGRWN